MGCNPHSKIRSGLDLWLAPRLPAAALRAPARPPGTETAATGRRCRPARPRPAPPGGAAAVRTPCPPRPSRDTAARTPEAPAVPTGPSYSYLTGNPAGTCTAARKCNCFLGKLAQRSPEVRVAPSPPLPRTLLRTRRACGWRAAGLALRSAPAARTELSHRTEVPAAPTAGP